MLDVCYCSAICTNWDNKANAIATHRVAKAYMNSLFKIYIPLLLYHFTRYPYYFTRYCLRTAGLMWKSEKANSSKIWPRCTAAHNSDRKVLSPWHYKVLKTSMHKGPIWECNLKFSFKLICFGTIHTLRQEKDWVSSKSGSFCFNVHCWKILLILSVTDLTKKLLCKLCKVASIGFYSPFHIAKWRVLGFTHHFTCFTWFFYLVVLFNNAYSVRSAISVWCFTHHSC